MQILRKTRVALGPFANKDADIVLRSSDGVTFYVFSSILGQASSIFKDMLMVPQPPTSPPTTTNLPRDKPIVHLTEDAKILDAFLRCLYPTPRPSVNISDLVALHRTGDKYDVEAVKQHVYKELSRYASLPAYCVQAYTIACYFDRPYEADRAAVQAVYLAKESVLYQSYPELELVSPSSRARLLESRTRALSAVADMCTPQYWLSRTLDSDTLAKYQLWDFYYDDRDKCECECVDGTLQNQEELESGSATSDEEEAWNHTAYYVRKWCWDYFREIESSIREQKLPVLEALRDPDALARAMEAAAACKTCRTGAIKVLLDLMKKIEEEVDYEIKRVIEEMQYEVRAVQWERFMEQQDTAMLHHTATRFEDAA